MSDRQPGMWGVEARGGRAAGGPESVGDPVVPDVAAGGDSPLDDQDSLRFARLGSSPSDHAGQGPADPAPHVPILRSASSIAPTFFVAGFWRRLAAGLIDLAVLAPVMLILTWLAAVITGIHLPPANQRGLDFWLDMLLARE